MNRDRRERESSKGKAGYVHCCEASSGAQWVRIAY